jgi:hypothetical protein
MRGGTSEQVLQGAADLVGDRLLAPEPGTYPATAENHAATLDLGINLNPGGLGIQLGLDHTEIGSSRSQD